MPRLESSPHTRRRYSCARSSQRPSSKQSQRGDRRRRSHRRMRSSSRTRWTYTRGPSPGKCSSPQRNLPDNSPRCSDRRPPRENAPHNSSRCSRPDLRRMSHRCRRFPHSQSLTGTGRRDTSLKGQPNFRAAPSCSIAFPFFCGYSLVSRRLSPEGVSRNRALTPGEDVASSSSQDFFAEPLRGTAAKKVATARAVAPL